MRWYTARFDARANRVETYRHADDFCDGDPLILIDASVGRFGQSPDGAEAIAAWVGRIVLADTPAARKTMGIGQGRELLPQHIPRDDHPHHLVRAFQDLVHP